MFRGKSFSKGMFEFDSVCLFEVCVRDASVCSSIVFILLKLL